MAAGGNMTPRYPYYLLLITIRYLIASKNIHTASAVEVSTKVCGTQNLEKEPTIAYPLFKATFGTFTIKMFKYASRHFPNQMKTTAKCLLTSSQQWAWRADPQLDRVMTKCSARHNTGQWLVDQRGIMGFILENCRCHYTL